MVFLKNMFLKRSCWGMMSTKSIGRFEMTDLCLEWLFEISVWSDWSEFGMTPHMILEWFFHLESDLSNNWNAPSWKLLDLLSFIQFCHIFSHLLHLQTANFVITFLFKLAFMQLWTDLAINGLTQRNFKRYSSFIPLFCQLELQWSMILCFELLVSEENDPKFQWHWGHTFLIWVGVYVPKCTKHVHRDLVIICFFTTAMYPSPAMLVDHGFIILRILVQNSPLRDQAAPVSLDKDLDSMLVKG